MNSWVRTSAALAAASLGDEPLAPSELDPSVRPPVGADALFAVPFFCVGAAAAVEPTARPSPLKFLSDGLPKQLPIVERGLHERSVSRCVCGECRSIARLATVNATARLHVPSRVELGVEGLLWLCLGGGSLAPVFSKGHEQVRHRRHRLIKTHLDLSSMHINITYCISVGFDDYFIRSLRSRPSPATSYLRS